jgi:hypothetical protein
MQMDTNSDVDDDIDFGNFKGIYDGEVKEKYICPETGAHFEYFDLCKRMSHLREQRKIIDAQLGLSPEPVTRKNEITFQISKRPALADQTKKSSSMQHLERNNLIIQNRVAKKMPERGRNNT